MNTRIVVTANVIIWTELVCASFCFAQESTSTVAPSPSPYSTQTLTELKQLQQRHRVVGDVRGGHGLFAVIELISDPIKRTPLAPWPQTPSQLTVLVQKAMTQGVSFAARGNLIILAPPLVIEEGELTDALVLLDRLLTEMESA